MALIDNSLLVQHAKKPSNYGPLDAPTSSATVDNMACGDSVSVGWIIHDGVIEHVGFTSRGCMLCKAATSILLEHVKGKYVADVQVLTDDDLLSMLGTSEISYSRRKCALMGLEALRAMLSSLHTA